MMALDLLEVLERQSVERPNMLALQETTGRRLTFSELHQRIGRVAGGLLAEGMRPGDRVLFTVPPGIDSIVLILAIVRAGGVVVAANPLMGPEVFASRVRLMEPRWVMATSLVYLLGRLRGPSFLRRLPVLPDLGAIHFVGRAAPIPLLLQFANYEQYFDKTSMQHYVAAANEPKKVLYYDTGHDLNDPQALEDRYDWLVKHINLRREPVLIH